MVSMKVIIVILAGIILLFGDTAVWAGAPAKQKMAQGARQRRPYLKDWKNRVGYFVGVLFFWYSFPAFAAGPGFLNPPEGNAAGSPQFVQLTQYTGDYQKGKVWKAMEFVEKIQNGILYTGEHRYNLAGVTVVDLSKDKNIPASPGGKKHVLLTFEGDQLKEAVFLP